MDSIMLGIWDDAGKSVSIFRALYRLKNIGASFRAFLAQCLQQLGYESCKSG